MMIKNFMYYAFDSEKGITYVKSASQTVRTDRYVDYLNGLPGKFASIQIAPTPSWYGKVFSLSLQRWRMADHNSKMK